MREGARLNERKKAKLERRATKLEALVSNDVGTRTVEKGRTPTVSL